MLAPMAAEVPSLDRRQRRRLETIEEVLDVAVDLMGEQGVAGLSIGEVARRMGIRPPSLYVYFDSKNDLYDALFERGARLVLAHMQELNRGLLVGPNASLEEQLLTAANSFCRWAVEHPAYTQLLFWRPVPGFEPSADAFAPAVAMVETSQQRFGELQRRGLIRPDVAIEDVQRDWVVIMTGVVTRQLANSPHEG